MPVIKNTHELISCVSEGNRFKFIFFWGHEQSGNDITKSCLSQWYYAPFIDDQITYLTAEHYMMAEKARFFNDQDVLAKVLKCSHPGEAKKLGRQVDNFNEDKWVKKRFEIVVQGNYLKFKQNKDLRTFLIGTGNRILVEASPVDKIWGIGLAQDDPKVEDPDHWKGQNLLGFALMEARQRLLNTDD